MVSASGVSAEVINCPTLDNYLINGKQWELSLDQLVCVHEDGHGSCYSSEIRFFKYDPLTKKIEGTGYEAETLSFNITANKVIQDEKEIRLQCTGTYSSSERSPGIIWGYWHRNNNGKIKAELPMDANEYKKCVAATDNKSFDCSR